MPQALRFALALIVGLSILAWGAAEIVHRVTVERYDRDAFENARSAVGVLRPALLGALRGGRVKELTSLVEGLVMSERLAGAAVCSADLQPLVQTSAAPAALSCPELGALLPGSALAPLVAGGDALGSAQTDGLRVAALTLVEKGKVLGILGWATDRRRAELLAEPGRPVTRFSFVAVGLSAALLTVIAAYLSLRSWLGALRRLLGRGASWTDPHRLLQAMRTLVERFSSEEEPDAPAGAWTPQRLKQTLAERLEGKRVVILANREPYIHERTEAGEVRVRQLPGGLVTALEPVMLACSGVWVAHGSGSADRETSDGQGHVWVPPGNPAYLLRRVWLSDEESKGYYIGFSNEALWPLCHRADARPIFRSSDWEQYQLVNRKFADAVLAEVDGLDPIILVQDYHFALVPRLLRERLPRATVITSWHIPWPNAERFGICPWHQELLEGLLGSSIIGFHTQQHCNNFLECAERFIEARVDREENAVVRRGRSTLVRAYPISVDWPSRWLTGLPPAEQCRAEVFAELGLRPETLLGLGVDRLDYTKGVEERLLAVERLLERTPALRGRFTFVQLAAPSRTSIVRYRQLAEDVHDLAARVNERFGAEGYRPVILLEAQHDPPTVFRYFRAANVCYVSSLHDGMNLVAKEFVAARDDERGVLVLSSFTGAARELTEALRVNPYDLDEASAALAAALSMSADEQRERMRSMRALVAEFNVYRWAGRMLVDAARVRQRDRMSGRLSDPLLRAAGLRW
jgi:trehalose 6-phosphate synthase